MEKLFVDTSVLLKIIMENYASPLEKFSHFIVFTSSNVIEKAMFKIVTLIIAKEEKMETHQRRNYRAIGKILEKYRLLPNSML